MTSVILSQEEIVNLCAEWQERLGLLHWRIMIRVARSFDMTLPEVMGEVIMTHAKAEAIIRILDPIDYPTDCPFEQDHEITIVHELLHILWRVTEKESGTEEYFQWEQAINTTARALVRLKREGVTLIK